MDIQVATGFRERLVGLAWRRRADHALLIPRCRSVHTFGMRFPLDLVWLDGDGTPLRIDSDVPPARVRRCREAAAVLEYPLPMAEKVKNRTTRISSKHQVTIPAAAFHAAGFRPGDVLHVEAADTGQIVLTRVDELLDRYCGILDSGGELRRYVDQLRDEWR